MSLSNLQLKHKGNCCVILGPHSKEYDLHSLKTSTVPRSVSETTNIARTEVKLKGSMHEAFTQDMIAFKLQSSGLPHQNEHEQLYFLLKIL